jgi:hypothetical protein
MDSKGNGLAILMPRCGVDSKAYREFIKIEDCQKRVKLIMGHPSNDCLTGLTPDLID